MEQDKLGSETRAHDPLLNGDWGRGDEDMEPDNKNYEGYKNDEDNNNDKDDNNTPYLPTELVSYILQLRSRIYSDYYTYVAIGKGIIWKHIHDQLISEYDPDYEPNTDTYLTQDARVIKYKNGINVKLGASYYTYFNRRTGEYTIIHKWTSRGWRYSSIETEPRYSA